MTESTQTPVERLVRAALAYESAVRRLRQYVKSSTDRDVGWRSLCRLKADEEKELLAAARAVGDE